jgi:hypothetical protein
MVADLSLLAIRWFGPGVFKAIHGEKGATLLTGHDFFVARAQFKRRC